MKAFRLNGMAIIAILFSISFTSCGDDYDDSIIIDRVDNLENRITQLEETNKHKYLLSAKHCGSVGKQRLCNKRNSYYQGW